MLLLTRREVICAIGAGALSITRTSAQEAPLAFDAIDHVEFYVSEVERTRDFLARVFGGTLLKNASAAKRYIKIGSAYLAFERPRTPGGLLTTDHVSVAIRNMDMTRVHALLDSRAIAYRDYPSGRDTAIVDGDGIRTQLSPENGWSVLMPPTFVPDTVLLSETAVFQPKGIEHVLLGVADPEGAARFYEKVFGPVSLRKDDRLWFQVGRSRIGVVKTAEGERPGVNYFCVSVEPFDHDAVVARLAGLGAKVESPRQPGAVSFRDLDGMRVQVSSPG